MNFSFLGAASFNWTLFITIMTYVLFFFIVLGAIGKGMKRGGLRASIRLVILVGFTIVAGLVSMPIAKALMGIDLSSLGVAYGDGIAQNLTEIIKGLLFEVEEIEPGKKYVARVRAINMCGKSEWKYLTEKVGFAE